MRDLIKTIPDVNALLALEPEELGAKLIFLIARRERDGRFHPNSYQIELELAVPPDAHYPPAQVPQAQLAISEAFAWLEAQALVVPEPGYNGQNGWRLLSRRARRFETELDFSSFAAAHRLPREALHPAMSEKVWLAFMRGDFDAAVFQATSAVEISVREASGLQNSVFGVDLMRRAFDVQKGRLTDQDAVKAEREALQHLFAGAIGYFKNPQSHREVALAKADATLEIVMFANLLLRIVDERRAAIICSPQADGS
ncbi:MAG TPA: TIGR02391 family protein [Beijerinckiaceae bacterium]|nr:TIGR02391 family protein [Beijerinckiaceae bacterium]